METPGIATIVASCEGDLNVQTQKQNMGRLLKMLTERDSHNVPCHYVMGLDEEINTPCSV